MPERFLELPSLVVLPTDVVVERAEPGAGILVAAGQLDPPLGPRDEPVTAGCDECRHVRSIHRDKGLAGIQRGRERGVEQRARGLRIAARPAGAPPLEGEPRPSDGVVTRERHRFVQQPIGGIEGASQRCDPRELAQDLGAAGIGGLVVQLRSHARLGDTEIVEVPQRTQSVGGQATSLPSERRAPDSTRASRALPCVIPRSVTGVGVELRRRP